MTTKNARLARLAELGQSVWLDYISRKILDNGELARLVADDSVTGVTSNPAIFEKSIRSGSDYDAVFAALPATPASAKSVYESIALADIAAACDVLRPVYDRSGGADGFASLEVSPELAHDTEGTLAEARRLWAALARPNAMIKVPATPAGIPAIRQLISEGINVNVTLLFAKDAYEKVAVAYIEGLSARAAAGKPVDHIASVASFFVSRIDSAVDARLEALAPAAASSSAASLAGQVAIANAKLAYVAYQRLFAGAAWQSLASAGARPQRLLWASTGTKNPKYRDVLYIEELIGPDTVNTMPPDTLRAFADHGEARSSLIEDVAGAEKVLAELSAAGISLDQITSAVLADGVKKFTEPFAALLSSIEERLAKR
ncbi:MAG TPA: transaldolase [Polyangiaceae bacterium]|nr:transaldolase [Polyangiaceae bacterium]